MNLFSAVRLHPKRVAFIGSAGVPNRYGGFESFLEHCGPVISRDTLATIVTCDSSIYEDKKIDFQGMQRIFIPVRANGPASILHDLIAFLRVFPLVDNIVVLGVSGGPWFPLFRLMCSIGGKRLLVNIDGVEWRRNKFGRGKRLLLKVLDQLAQKFSHTVIFDNVGLHHYLLKSAKKKAICIPYSGDHVLRLEGLRPDLAIALTICRIEPENNLEMLIKGALLSSLRSYTIVGNWNNSAYGRQLRQRFANEERLALLDPIYEAVRLAELRESCGVYIHGHSVGGTNPSLVEMLFYDCHILCFDVDFNRHTASESARYFSDPKSLALLIDTTVEFPVPPRQSIRKRFTATAIADQYIAAMIQEAK